MKVKCKMKVYFTNGKVRTLKVENELDSLGQRARMEMERSSDIEKIEIEILGSVASSRITFTNNRN